MPHLLLDAYCPDKAKLGDMAFVETILRELPLWLGMGILSGPHLASVSQADKGDAWGISGVVIISESHIAIHTWPARSWLNIDVFSCRDFNQDALVSELARLFLLRQMSTKLIARNLGERTRVI